MMKLLPSEPVASTSRGHEVAGKQSARAAAGKCRQFMWVMWASTRTEKLELATIVAVPDIAGSETGPPSFMRGPSVSHIAREYRCIIRFVWIVLLAFPRFSQQIKGCIFIPPGFVVGGSAGMCAGVGEYYK